MAATGDVVRGKLIVFEGIDGTGKTTVAAALAERLRAAGLAVVTTREPWTSVHGVALRKLLAAAERTTRGDEELALFHADRAEHVAQVVAPALARGDWVVQDRTYWSTAAYQGARGVPVAEILARSAAIAPKPDLTLLLQLAPERALARIEANRAAKSSFERLDDLRAVDRVYRALAAGESTIAPIDVDRPLAAVIAEVERTCRARLGRP